MVLKLEEAWCTYAFLLVGSLEHGLYVEEIIIKIHRVHLLGTLYSPMKFGTRFSC